MLACLLVACLLVRGEGCSNMWRPRPGAPPVSFWLDLRGEGCSNIVCVCVCVGVYIYM